SGLAAKALAHCWQQSRGFPEAVRDALDADPTFLGAQILFGLVEPSARTPSHSDLFVLAKLADGALATIAVEGKGPAPFGDSVGEWLANEPSRNKLERLEQLVETVGLALPLLAPLRYPLLQRTAS